MVWGRGNGSRHERFYEAIEIIQGLLTGELSNYRGKYLQIDNAKLYDRPASKPPVVIAAGGPKAARFAREKSDGLMATEPRKDIVEAYGRKGPRYAEVAMCCARKEDDARTTAHKYFRWSLTGWPVQAELPDPKGFAAASKHIAPEAVAAKISCGPSAEKHLQAIHKFTEAGFDHIVLVQIGPDQDYFFDLLRVTPPRRPAIQARACTRTATIEIADDVNGKASGASRRPAREHVRSMNGARPHAGPR